MNYLPFAGYYFYGAANSTERAAYFCSWGLISSAPILTIVPGGSLTLSLFLLV